MDRIQPNRVASINILAVWMALGGDPLKRGRAKAFWRDGGNASSVSIDAQRNVWWDHAGSVGGGILDLVKTVLAVSKSDALRWLESEALIEPRTTTPHQRAEYARRRREAEDLAARVAHWWHARQIALDRAKRDALAVEDFEGLEAAASLLWRLQKGGAPAITQQWLEERENSPPQTEAFEKEGAVDLLHAELVCAAIVAVLARAGGISSVT